jgi:hypothetical protein
MAYVMVEDRLGNSRRPFTMAIDQSTELQWNIRSDTLPITSQVRSNCSAYAIDSDASIKTWQRKHNKEFLKTPCSVDDLITESSGSSGITFTLATELSCLSTPLLVIGLPILAAVNFWSRGLA